MPKQLLMGNAAIAMGAIAAGVSVVTGYPGTPSTEVLETIAKNNDGSIYVEWSVNEKVALEVGAGAAYCGKRVLVTMKQVGLNVAADPLMSLAYVGIQGGMVVLVADDPGPISSQTEQDTRSFGAYAKLPVFDPSSPEEAYAMMEAAFICSERYKTPVLFRPTTRVCHGCAVVDIKEGRAEVQQGFFEKDPKWVIFPRLSYAAHLHIEKRNPEIGREFSASPFNQLSGSGAVGVLTGGVSYAYLMECLPKETRLLKVGTPFPFPEDLVLQFLQGLRQVLVVEELDPVLERGLLQVIGSHGLQVTVKGKLSGHVQAAGENTPETVKKQLMEFLEKPYAPVAVVEPPQLPMRPPVLCAGCPHRASFYAVKQAAKGMRTVFCGDIGCYTLGNAVPLHMVDTCLCMGAGITAAQGIYRGEAGVKTVSFVGDSTFFHTGISGIVNGVYNKSDITVIVLDNSTTAMTGHQPHPGTGITMMGDVAEKVSIEAVLRAIGVQDIQVVDPLDQQAAVAAAKHALAVSGVTALIFRSPCIAVVKSEKQLCVQAEACTGCKKCVRELGCPALVKAGAKIAVDAALCTGCGLCAGICPTKALVPAQKAQQKPVPLAPSISTQEKPQGQPPTSLHCLLAGVGGQGTLLASKLLAHCAMERGLFVRTAETIGMAQRGGSVVSHVRIGSTVESPLIPKAGADLLVAFEPAEAVRCLPYLKKDGAVVVCVDAIKPVTDALSNTSYEGDTMLAFLREQVKNLVTIEGNARCSALGSSKVLNLVLLGAAAKAGYLGFSVQELQAAIQARIPVQLQNLNLRAVEEA